MTPAPRGLPRAKASGAFRIALAANACALVCALVVLLAVDNFSPLARVNQFLQDWEMASTFAAPMPQDPDIVIIALDEDTLRQFPYRSPVDRQYVSDLVRALERHGPAVIGIDLQFDQPTEAAKDAALRHTLVTATVPLVVSYIPVSAAVAPEQQAFEDAMVPAKLRSLPDLGTDQFDTARFVYGGRVVDGHYLLSFPRAVARAAGVATPAMQVPIIWRGRPAPTPIDAEPKLFKEYSALATGVLQDAWLRSKIVLIGSDVTLVDRHRTPFSTILPGDKGQLPGVVIQAEAVSQLIHRTPSPLTGWSGDLAIAFAMALIGALLGMGGFSLVLRVLGLGAVIILFWAGCVALFHFHDILIGLIPPPLATMAGFVTMDALSGRAARRQRKFIQSAFSRYVSPKLVEQMIEDPDRMSLKSERRVMTYLFSDIENFTTMSERMDSETLAPLVNAYLDGMTEIVLKHDGMVDKFIGDSVFAVFNAPLELPDHAQRAVECMLEMDRFTEDFRRRQVEQGIALGATRIGVHTGAAVIGNFGSQARFTYTAQGDAVNTASRLEGANKYFGTRLCVSDSTRILCHGIAFRPLASVILKGKTEFMDLWEPLQDDALKGNYRDAYAAAYQELARETPQAQALFAALAEANPQDPCVQLHQARLARGERGARIVMADK